MNNPRNFADKIAVLMQKQAEDAEAFEKILGEVQPLTSGNISVVQSSDPVPKEQVSTVNYEDNIGPTWTKQNECNTARYPYPFCSNQTSNGIPNPTPSSICSTNLRDYNESLSSTDIAWKWTDPGSSLNAALASSMAINHMAEISENFTISSVPFTSTNSSPSSTNNLSCKINDDANMQIGFPVGTNINSNSEILNFNANTLDHQATKEQYSAYMAEPDPSSTFGISSYSPNSTSGFSRLKIENTTNSLIQSNSISTSNQFTEQQIPMNLPNNQIHQIGFQICDESHETLNIQSDNLFSIF